RDLRPGVALVGEHLLDAALGRGECPLVEWVVAWQRIAHILLQILDQLGVDLRNAAQLDVADAAERAFLHDDLDLNLVLRDAMDAPGAHVRLVIAARAVISDRKSTRLNSSHTVI